MTEAREAGARDPATRAGRERGRVRVGVVLPTFRRSVQCCELARAYRDVGVDGVFTYDHLFPNGSPHRPALHGPSVLAAVAAAVSDIHVGTLVARVGLLSPAELLGFFTRLAAICGPHRVVAGLGLGDAAALAEATAFGLPRGDREQRGHELATLAGDLLGRGLDVWIGGNGAYARSLVARSGATWNAWALPPSRLAEAGVATTWAAAVRFTPGSDGRDRRDPAPAAALPEGVLQGDPAGVAQYLAGCAGAGARWVVIGPIADETRDGDQPSYVGETVRALHAAVSRDGDD